MEFAAKTASNSLSSNASSSIAPQPLMSLSIAPASAVEPRRRLAGVPEMAGHDVVDHEYEIARFEHFALWFEVDRRYPFQLGADPGPLEWILGQGEGEASVSSVRDVSVTSLPAMVR